MSDAMPSILLIEDDKAIGRLMRGSLQYEGFDVEWSETGRQVEERVKQFSPNLVLLDLMLPHGVDGLAICHALTESRLRTPVIILTAKDQQADKVRGLMAGADDYVTKPFAFDELLARIHAVLRRTTARLDELRRLRQEIEPDPRHPRFIQTVYGDGYRLTVPG